MEFSAEQIAGLLHGVVVGNPSITVNGLAKIEEGYAGALSFLSNPKYEEYIYTTKSSVCIVNNTFVPAKELPETLTLVKVEDAYACFAKLLELYNQMRQKQPKIESPSFIAESAQVSEGLYLGAFAYIGEDVKVGKNVKIFPNAYIGDGCVIGDDTILYSGVKLYADTKVGARCILHAGAVIGSDGFGFAPDAQGVFSKIPQIGNVVIEDDVEIGANTTIDCATMGSTYIRKGAKIDNLVHLAHNVEVGNHSALAAQVGIAGSTKVGKHVFMGGQVGVIGHIHIGDGAKIAAQSGLGSTVKAGATVMGSPAMASGDYKKSYIGFVKLPEILKRLGKIEKEINTQNKTAE